MSKHDFKVIFVERRWRWRNTASGDVVLLEWNWDWRNIVKFDYGRQMFRALLGFTVTTQRRYGHEQT